ncbi:MAG: DUF2490 domain-containing protein [Myxococcaceae bacterium]
MSPAVLARLLLSAGTDPLLEFEGRCYLRRSMRRRLLPLLAISSVCFGQVATDYQAWVGINLEGKADALLENARFGLGFESRFQNQPRQDARISATRVEEQNPNALLVFRGQVGYQVHPLLVSWVGYLYVPIFWASERREDVSEHRIFQQVTGMTPLGPLQVNYRVRLEERFRASGDNAAVKLGEGQWAFRLRQQLRFALPLTTEWKLIVFDEFHVHLNSTDYPSRTGLDQNRAFIGVGYRASSALQVEAGYLNQYVERVTDRDQINHVLVMSLNFGAEFVRVD